ncbi:MAG: bifunctional metallophosphatase/5'-nucleotidase [Acidobacteriia bacterium]|jgi:2',3'-cyclic-nucleotide 2'-phosphodiesterase/3'-nucleotidase|nr:bifunctional metallophosphatase/5'-nucleotidase [Terriglobia bacterium]
MTQKTRNLLLSALVVAGVLTWWYAERGLGETTITLLATTDLHGNVYPFDYLRNAPAERGLAKIATLVRQIRADQKNVLLLDCGDTIQGSPLAYYDARKQPDRPNTTIAAMNALGYDAMAVGNHEFNFGLDVLWKAKRESRFPWLSANTRQQYGPGSAGYFAPYIVKEVGSVRVAIVGFTTPGVPRWEMPENYRGYEFEPIVAAAQRVIPLVRPQADLVVAILHSGLGRDPVTGRPVGNTPEENVAWDLAEQVPGIDVILFGHSHQELPELFVNGVLLAQARNWGQSLARVDIEMSRSVTAAWTVSRKHSTTIPVTESVPADPEILALARSTHEATQAYLDTQIATATVSLEGTTARYEDHPLVDQIHRVQLEAAQADVSLATLFYTGLRIEPGPVTIRHMAGLYLYENHLYAVEMTGAQLKEALERAASFFPAWPPEDPGRLRLPGYNADLAEGVSYVMDLSRPVGDRIRELRFRGAPLDPARKLRVAVNHYRYHGGGHYEVFRGLPVLWKSAAEIRELLIEHVRRQGTLLTRASGNWRLVPPEAAAALLQQARSRETAPTADEYRLRPLISVAANGVFSLLPELRRATK